MAQSFYIQPGSDITAGLTGLSSLVSNIGEEKRKRQEEAEKEQRMQEGLAAAREAGRSEDPDLMAEVSYKYPELFPALEADVARRTGIKNEDRIAFNRKLVADPENAERLYLERIQYLDDNGRDSTDTRRALEEYRQNPAAKLMEAKMTMAAMDQEGYKAYKESQAAPEDADTKVVGDFLINSKTGEVIFDGSGEDAGSPEFGLSPLIYRNPETGEYQPFLPNKAGGMQALPTPEGMQFTPDSGRLGYNPVNIAEQAQAQTAAERLKAMPAQQRAMVRRRQQATLMDNSIDKALEQANNWTTGFIGNLTKKVPGSPAYDLASTLDTIKGNIGFDKLQEMRDASPTGGALGQISTFELENLQSVLGNLEQSQSKKQFEYNLEQVRNALRDIVHGSEQQFIDTYGAQPPVPGNAQPQAPVRRRFNPATGMIE